MRIGSQDCLAIGVGSNGKLASCVYRNYRSFDDYGTMINSRKFPIESCITLSKEDEMRRVMMGELELLSINKQKFKGRFGDEPENIFSNTINQLKEKGLIVISDSEIRLIDLGKIWGHNASREFCSPQYIEQLDRLRGTYYPVKKKV